MLVFFENILFYLQIDECKLSFHIEDVVLLIFNQNLPFVYIYIYMYISQNNVFFGK